MSETRIAIIDLGTNTFNLLIAEKRMGRFVTLHQERIAARMGVGGINNGFIKSEAVARVLEALKKLKLTIEKWQVNTVTAFGTSALRSATNGIALIEKIYIETGIKVKIISGEDEAMLIYFGVRSAVPLGSSKSLIVDIGGGSVEFVIANADEMFWKKSVEIGGQRLIEKFQHHDPILPEERAQITEYLEVQLTPLLSELKKHLPETLVGSSGSFDTLSEIYCHKQGLPFPKEPETPLTIAGFETIFDELLHKTRSERLAIPGMIEMRVDMIVVACCLIQFLLEKHSFKSIRVSAYSLKEGVLASTD
ncbi:MAG: exopolyphosphatase [Cytophagales bacterium]|jgi:exopolyphosphatase/guanosine-5'-triphosphate,3'-diphosphate pyrophosphatase|nr:exopolyphosphatase [Cytophagales bacterium]MCA6388283.1 exopolyphosphatase [Cytophagales bacterium]MCA6392374.1 exopolyphosphatase [Cytophagales bacterium]MCA6393709.1 exopolyphosphatase [Cytophagales bacterium]MCA6398527.1 exopolyphosphatase [Cytophagales bacterium]